MKDVKKMKKVKEMGKNICKTHKGFIFKIYKETLKTQRYQTKQLKRDIRSEKMPHQRRQHMKRC